MGHHFIAGTLVPASGGEGSEGSTITVEINSAQISTSFDSAHVWSVRNLSERECYTIVLFRRRALGEQCGPSQHALAEPEPGKALVHFIQDDGPEGNHQHATLRIGLDGAWVGAYKHNSYFSPWSPANIMCV
jgi:hypothetical protein